MERRKSFVRRRGVALLIALACLAVVGMISAGIVTRAGQFGEQARRQARQLQAEWLAESAVARAAARLALDPQYTGETWTVSAAELGGRDAAEIVIEVTPGESQPDLRDVRVVADVARAPYRRARRGKQITVRLPRPASSEEREP